MVANSPAKLRILHIDDDPLVLQVSNRWLSSAGFDVQTALSPAAARAAAVNSVDLLIIDLLLPGEHGLRLCEELRAKGWRKPILLLTCLPLSAAEKDAIAACGAVFMAKPFGPQELIRRVKECLAADLAPREAEGTVSPQP